MKAIALSGAFAVACLFPVFVAAQTFTATPSAVETAAFISAKSAATRTFLDRNAPTRDRLAALKNIGYPDDKTKEAFLRLGTNVHEDGAIRLEALRRYPYGDKYLDAVLKIIDDATDGDEDLDAGLILDLSRRATSIPPAVVRQRIQTTLRKRMDDTRPKVRLFAFRALIGNHDSVAANVLDESLRRGTAMPIPVPDAIDLLNEDGAFAHFSALRPYLQSNDAVVQGKAAQALAADQESRQRIVALAMASGSALPTRLLALRALAREDANYPNYAIGLVEDAKADPVVRDAAMTTIVGRMNYSAVPIEQQIRFARAVDKLSRESGPQDPRSAKARANAVEIKEYLRKAFPESQN